MGVIVSRPTGVTYLSRAAHVRRIWHGGDQPDDYKIKTVTPIVLKHDDPMLGGLIRESKPRTLYSYNSTFDLHGAQDDNNLKFEWGK